MEKEIGDETKTKVLRGDDRITTPRMTVYEYPRVIGMRALQLSKGAACKIDNQIEGDGGDYMAIARKELEQGKIDFIIRRPLPDGTVEEWKISELEIDFDMFR